MTPTNASIKAEFGLRVRLVRRLSGYRTARRFARDLGVEENTLTMWERGERLPENPVDLWRIKQTTGATLDFLFFGDPAGLPVSLHALLREAGAWREDADGDDEHPSESRQRQAG